MKIRLFLLTFIVLTTHIYATQNILPINSFCILKESINQISYKSILLNISYHSEVNFSLRRLIDFAYIKNTDYINDIRMNSADTLHLDVSNWNNSRWIVPLGSSGHPGSKHYSDQSQYWAEVKTIPQLWDWKEIEKSYESKQRLSPELER